MVTWVGCYVVDDRVVSDSDVGDGVVFRLGIEVWLLDGRVQREVMVSHDVGRVRHHRDHDGFCVHLVVGRSPRWVGWDEIDAQHYMRDLDSVRDVRGHWDSGVDDTRDSAMDIRARSWR